MGTDRIRWGILGTGNIARQFARGLQAVKDADLVAAGSRTADSANRFGAEFNVPACHATYADLATDPNVDAIYVATPHVFHRDNAMLCLEAGKAVLCEKPFAVNAAESAQMMACAREHGVFLMEAMWTHFFPAMANVRDLIAEGAIGEIRMAQADFGFRGGWDPSSRLLNLELGGGALLDVGVYVVAFAQMIFGQAPERISSVAHLGETGVDEQAGMVLGYPGGAMAVLACAVRTSTDQGAAIYGTEGSIRIPAPFWQPDQIVLNQNGQKPRTIKFKRVGNGYNYEAQEVGRCLRAGLTESPVMPLAKTMDIMTTLDRVRDQWNLRYPCED